MAWAGMRQAEIENLEAGLAGARLNAALNSFRVPHSQTAAPRWSFYFGAPRNRSERRYPLRRVVLRKGLPRLSRAYSRLES